MEKQIINKIFFLFLLLSFSAQVKAEGYAKGDWQSIVKFLKLNIAKEVNKAVSPPAAPCVGSPVPELKIVKTKEAPPSAIALTVEKNKTLPEVKIKPEIISSEPELKSDPEIVNNEETTDQTNQLMENFTKLGGDPIALKQSLCFLNKYKSTKFKAAGDPSRAGGIKIDNQRYLTINDLNVPMYKSRLFVIDLETGKIKTYFSSHGYGGHKGVPVSDSLAEGFSNIGASYATPRGFFITGNRREGSSDPRWKFSMKLHGLQSGVNDNSFARDIIMHPFPGMPSDSASSENPNSKQLVTHDQTILSKGCTMVSEEHAGKIINEIKASNGKGGSLYYNYTPIEKNRGSSYCGDEGLIRKN